MSPDIHNVYPQSEIHRSIVESSSPIFNRVLHVSLYICMYSIEDNENYHRPGECWIGSQVV